MCNYDKVKVCWLCGHLIPEPIIQKIKTPVEKIGMSTRASNCLRHSGIECVEQLLKMTDKDLLSLRNMGSKTLAEIKEKIKSLGFDLK